MKSNTLSRRHVLAGTITGIVCTMAKPFVRPLVAADQPQRFALALHGGAGGDPARMTAEDRKILEASLAAALKIGVGILAAGGTSLDAVERVIRYLEDDPLFNAGRGAVYNSVGGHELDAAIMDGRNLACGAVAGITTVKNPISLARLVMTKTRHVLLAGAGAEKFAAEMQVERVEPAYFDTDKQFQSWQRAKAKAEQAAQPGEPHKGTVGCVALDSAGNLAAGTSTGGITNKKFGRVGDSPIIGAGTYADNATCAVSCTGVGEEFIRHAVAYDISARIAYKQQSLADAVSLNLRERLQPGDGGIIAVGRDGTIVTDFSTGGMASASADSTGRHEVKLGR